MKKKNQINENYLDNKPRRKDGLEWTVGEDGLVTLQIENKGVLNRVFQVLFKKPKISYIHLDELGSFVWPLIDGQKTITELGIPVKEHFGDKAEPLYERLAKYFQILHSYKFITY